MSDEVKLLPCDHCGGEAKRNNGLRGDAHEIECTGCGMLTALSKDATERWNARVGDERLLNEIAEMMDEFVDNWPKPKRVSTALALIAKTLREATRAIEATRPTEQGLGVPASPSGHSRAEPEEVSVVPTSVPNAAYALPLAGYPVPETVATREHSLHCFACGGALSHSCICERVVLPRDGLRSLIFWVQTDTASAIEARRAADSEAGAVHESAVPQGDAHE